MPNNPKRWYLVEVAHHETISYMVQATSPEDAAERYGLEGEEIASVYTDPGPIETSVGYTTREELLAAMQECQVEYT